MPILTVVLFLVGGCATPPAVPLGAERSPAENEGRCAPPVQPAAIQPAGPRPGAFSSGSSIEPHPAVVPGLSPQSMRIAQIIGIDHLLERLVALRSEQGRGQDVVHLAGLEIRQQIFERLLLASLDVASATAEVKCERERADQLGDRLEEERNRKVGQLTIFAIIGGALVGILSGGLHLAGEETAAAAGAISGGVLETVFGTAALVFTTHHEFRHRRNVLHEVWTAPSQPALLPASVWHYLSVPSDPPLPRSLRESIVSDWRVSGRLGEPRSDAERRRLELLMGAGGRYQIEDLRARAAMLDLLAAHIDLMSQDLNLLVRELSALGAGGSPSEPTRGAAADFSRAMRSGQAI